MVSWNAAPGGTQVQSAAWLSEEGGSAGLHLPDPVTFPCVGDLGECRDPGPSYIHELWGPQAALRL